MTDANGFATTYLYDNLGSWSACRGTGRHGLVAWHTKCRSRPTPTTPMATCSRPATATITPRRYTYNALDEVTSVDQRRRRHRQYTYDGDGSVLTDDRRPGPHHQLHVQRPGRRADRDPALRRRDDEHDYDAAGDLLSRRRTRMTTSRPTRTTRPTRWRPRPARPAASRPIHMTSSAT